MAYACVPLHLLASRMFLPQRVFPWKDKHCWSASGHTTERCTANAADGSRMP